jgi:hypothetical protein
MLPKLMLTRKFFTPLRTTDMDKETTAAKNALSEGDAPRKSGRPQPIPITSTINIIRLQSDLKKRVKGELR